MRYTPTDEEIRTRYTYWASEPLDFVNGEFEAREAEFDRWQEKHDREVGAGTLTGVAQAYYDNGDVRTAAELLEIAKRIRAGEGG